MVIQNRISPSAQFSGLYRNVFHESMHYNFIEMLIMSILNIKYLNYLCNLRKSYWDIAALGYDVDMILQILEITEKICVSTNIKNLSHHLRQMLWKLEFQLMVRSYVYPNWNDGIGFKWLWRHLWSFTLEDNVCISIVEFIKFNNHKLWIVCNANV